MRAPGATPTIDEMLNDEQAQSDVEWLKQFILVIRNIRGEMDLSPNKPLNVLLRGLNADDEVKLEVCHWCEESIQEDDAYVASCLSFWHKECYDAQQDV